MDFFQHQDQARRNTGVLVILLLLAVAGLIAITTLFLSGFLYYFQFGGDAHVRAYEQGTDIWTIAGQIVTPQLLLSVSAVVVSFVAIGSLYKWLQLRGGGRAVAESLGGQLIPMSSQQADERRILNVVEEMAIASGIPVPPVYLLDEEAINAFAAGYSPEDAVIGITRGCLHLLDRDELQGVIAHEFSHILHGDMRLNIRLIGILHGILAIGLIGRVLMYSGHSPLQSRRRSEGNSAMLLGVGLIIIGYVGIVFGNLIKAAVSRQREFLADASAVQFTRNPQGIADALKKIGGFSQGSALHHPNTEQFSHLYFGEGIHHSLNSLFATHPPLQERIKRIQPQWQGAFINPQTERATSFDSNNSPDAAISAFTAGSGTITAAAASPSSPLTDSIASIGAPTEQHLSHARQLLQALPIELKEAANTPLTAGALVYCLLLDSDNSRIRQQQLTHLQQRAHPIAFRALSSLTHFTILPAWRLTLLELAMPSLKSLSASQVEVFKGNVIQLIKIDGQVSLFEWCLYRILIQHLEPVRSTASNLDLNNSATASALIFNFVAQCSDNPEAAFQQGAKTLGLALSYNPANNVHLPSIDAALKHLQNLKPLHKPRLLKALAGVIEYDNDIRITEIELFRAIADSLQCPMPPLTGL